MKTFKVFGRITATKADCDTIISSFFQTDECLACYERADDGCSRDHSHFIAQAEYKNLKSLRQAFSDKCFKILGERNQYSIKEYEEDKDAEAYICKGHKKDAAITPDIFINNYNIDVEEAYNRFHKVQAEIKETKKTVCVWKEVSQYIKDRDPKLLTGKIKRDTAWKIGDYLYNYYLSRGKMIQGKYVQQCIIRTIIAHNFKDRSVKGQMIQEWIQDFQYEDSFMEPMTRFSYDELIDPDDNLL